MDVYSVVVAQSSLNVPYTVTVEMSVHEAACIHPFAPCSVQIFRCRYAMFNAIKQSCMDKMFFTHPEIWNGILRHAQSINVALPKIPEPGGFR